MVPKYGRKYGLNAESGDGTFLLQKIQPNKMLYILQSDVKNVSSI